MDLTLAQEGERASGAPVTLTVERLQHLIKTVAFAAAADDSRPVMCGVLTSLDRGELTMVAADAFRLAKNTVPTDEGYAWPMRVLIPASFLLSVAKKLPKGERVTMDYYTREKTPGRLSLKAGDFEASTLLIEGQYPNWESIILKDPAHMATVACADMLAALKEIKEVANESENITRLHFGEGVLTLYAEAEAYKEGPLQVSMDATTDILDFAAVYNWLYLKEIASCFPRGYMTMTTKLPAQPALFTAEGQPGWLAMIMPKRINR